LLIRKKAQFRINTNRLRLENQNVVSFQVHLNIDSKLIISIQLDRANCFYLFSNLKYNLNLKNIKNKSKISTNSISNKYWQCFFHFHRLQTVLSSKLFVPTVPKKKKNMRVNISIHAKRRKKRHSIDRILTASPAKHVIPPPSSQTLLSRKISFCFKQ